MSTEHVGKMARMMIANHHKNRPTLKAELCAVLSITKGQLETMMAEVASFLQNFGLEMGGIEKQKSGQMDKLFLRKAAGDGSKRAKLEVTDDEKRLFFIFSVLQAENNNLISTKLEEVGKCQYFVDMDVTAYLKRQKINGYVTHIKVGDDLSWSYGWRFYLEYGDVLDITDYFKSNIHPK